MYPVWFIVGFWVLLAVAYVFIGGVTYRFAEVYAERRCQSCSKGYSCYRDHEVGAFFIGALWPLGVPLVVGITVAGKVANSILNAKEKELT